MIIQFIKFGIVGGINGIFYLTTYYIMIFLNFKYLIATISGYIFCSIVGFILNRIWVFKNQKKVSEAIFRFYLSYGIHFLLNISLMYLFIDKLLISKYISPIFTLCITMVLNFFLNKYWVFPAEKV
jgi:putative flippase GtrA